MATDTTGIEQYDRRTIQLHWATAILVTVQWVAGRLNHLLPKGPLRLDIWSVHVLLGFLLVVVILWRIWWRATAGRKLPPPQPGVQHILAQATHALLYFLMVGVAGLGVLNVFAHGFPLFGVWSFPKIGGKGYAHIVNDWHDLFANLIAAVVVLHAAAAIAHRYIQQDGVFNRMWPAARGD